MLRFQAGLCVLIFLLWAPAGRAEVSLELPNEWLEVSDAGPWVVRIDAVSRDVVDDLSLSFDVWKISPLEDPALEDPALEDPALEDPALEVTALEVTVEVLVSERDYRRLKTDGFELHLDREKTEGLARLGVPLPGQSGGIPGFPCYRTVEETYATAQAITVAHPDFATWIDVGDSWAKVQDSNAGFDIHVLKLTQSAVLGPKPIFFANFAIHAREYTTAELGTRFAEFLADGYGVDPDITWLLDHHEVHLMLQANPDGRKRAETGLFWRKNTNNNFCSNTNDRGVDLNRNFDFEWNCCSGSSGSQCSTVYRGPSGGSEPEIQVLQDYVKSIFPDQRGPAVDDPAPDDATGVAMDIHSSGELVLWPWGFQSAPPANGVALRTLGRKIAVFNDHRPLQVRELTLADGGSIDYYYGELGVAGIAFELGTQFFESCTFFENDILQKNIDSLFYAAKVARTPYLTPAGPEAMAVTAPTEPVSPGDLVALSATLDDTRFNQSNGTEPTQTVVSAEVYVDVPPWSTGAIPLAMIASDGTFDEGVEEVEMMLDTTGLGNGRHTVFVRGTDSVGNVGLVAAAFLQVGGDGLFEDGFETGDTMAWSSTSP